MRDEADKARQRVLRLSRVNAWSVVAIAGFFAIVSIGSLSLVGFVVGSAVTLAGFMEVRGHLIHQFNFEEEDVQVRIYQDAVSTGRLIAYHTPALK